MPQTIFCANGCAGDDVAAKESHHTSAIRKSLPKRRKSRKKVENSVAVIRESLPKRRKSAEKVENPMIYHLQFTNSNTIYARNRTIYAKGVFVH